MESARGNIFSSQAQPKISSKNPQHSLLAVVPQQQGSTTVHKPCSCCSEDHYVASCPLFKGKSVVERLSFVEDKKLCKTCLSDHDISACTSQKRCRTCKVGRHHTLLHYSNKRFTTRGKNMIKMVLQYVITLELTNKTKRVIFNLLLTLYLSHLHHLGQMMAYRDFNLSPV